MPQPMGKDNFSEVSTNHNPYLLVPMVICSQWSYRSNWEIYLTIFMARRLFRH